MVETLKSGRPPKSEIRENIVEILFLMGRAHGYDISKVYKEIFPKCTQRVIYYHLNQGAKLDIFKVDKIVKEKGDFSWGGQAEKIYYSLGKNATPKMNLKVRNYLDKLEKQKNKSEEI